MIVGQAILAMRVPTDFGDTIVGILKVAGILILIIFVGSLLFSFAEWIKSRTSTVKDGELAVIYRRGRFDRLAKPGWMFRWPSETIERTLVVKDRPRSFSVENLFFYGIPVGFTFSFWSRFDPERAAGKDRERLRNLVMFSDSEREHQVLLKIRDSYITRMSELEKSTPLPKDAPLLDKFLPIVPGMPDSDQLLQNVRIDLQQTLPSLGVFVNPTHALTVTGLIIPPELAQGFSRGRMVELIRRSHPELSEDRLAQLVAASEGHQTIKTTTIDLKGGEGQAVAEFKIGDDEDRAKLKVYPTQKAQAAAQPQSQVNLEQESAPGPVNAQEKKGMDEMLTERDLSYLKRVPAGVSESRSAA